MGVGRVKTAKQAVGSLGDALCFRGVKGSQKLVKHDTLTGHSQRAVVYQGLGPL